MTDPYEGKTIGTYPACFSSRLRWVFCVGLFGMMTLLVGEVSAQWLACFSTAEQLARQRSHPLCLYFGNSAVAACRTFENNVLRNPSVASALRAYVVAQLNPTQNEDLIERFGIFRIPAVVLIDPAGNVFYQEQGNITAVALLPALLRYSLATAPTAPRSIEPVIPPPPSPSPTAFQPVSATPVIEAGIATTPVVLVERLKPIRIRAQSGTVRNLRVHYRIRGESNYLSTPMQPQREPSGDWVAEIPAWIVTPRGVEYYISGQADNQPIGVPQNFRQQPFVIEVR